jgi:hypothetical protein
MQDFRRYALYAMAPNELHGEASQWLGWDSRKGKQIEHPTLEGLPASVADLTATPRKYGFHGTMKPPFRLAHGKTQGDLETACATRLGAMGPASVERMVVQPIDGFVALVPQTPSESLNRLCNEVVAGFEDFRAPLNGAELTKRRKSRLTEAQEANLARWGYPYVMAQFRFHMTLSGRVTGDDASKLATRLQNHFAPLIPQPFPVTSISLLGEGDDGFFHVIDAYALAS